VHDALRGLQAHLDNARQYVDRPPDGLAQGLCAADERIYTMLDEMARTVGASCLREEGERQTSFATSLIDEYAGALFLVAPAGFGKTSFCRWHALNDLDLLLQEHAKTLPVYVPLHQLGRIDSSTDFKAAFLRHAGVSALLPKHGQVAHDRVRVYLDGLDEVASETTKRRIGQLAREASDNDPSLQVIITARDYVYGPWTAWMPRIHLSGFGEKQVQELVANWLDHDDERVALFFGQIDKVEALKSMMVVPLLATLIVLVFKQTGKLPENKTRLYEIFVDLHNGGWDLAKGIQRPSRFSAAEKMFVLKRIAARVHAAKRREILDDHCAELAKDTLRKVEWPALKSELVRDGLILPLGGMVAFSHHSFQEFLTAKHLLGDPDQFQLNASCEKYLQGSDWWFEVLCFHIDLVGKPHEMRQWLDERLAAVCKLSSSYRAGAEARVASLKGHIAMSFPYATGSV
jgi:predicted NACHT family NTPase